MRLARMFGGAPLVWTRMQGACDPWHAVRTIGVSGIPEIAA